MKIPSASRPGPSPGNDSTPVKNARGSRPKELLALLLVSVSLLLSGCAEQDTPALKIAVNPWPGYAYFAVAKEMGFPSDSGALELEVIETASLSDSLRAFERGQVDLIGGTLAELADINAHGKRPAKGVLVLNRSVGGDMIVATERIETLGDLEGRRVALETGSANVLVLAAAANQREVDLEKVTLIPLPQGEMPAALDKGKIDAAVTYPPVSLDLLNRPDTHRLFDTSHTPNAVIDILIVAEDVMDNQADALRKLIEVHERALAWSRENPDQALKVIARHTGLAPKELQSLDEAIEMLSVEEQQEMWKPGGPLEVGLRGASDVLVKLHNRDGPSADEIPPMLDATLVTTLATP